jgi:nicotinamidase-related amidase
MTGNSVSEGDLHGSAPDKCPTALLLIDVINDLDFPEADELLRTAIPMARQLRTLKDRAHRAGIPALYINDNFGRWRSDFPAIIKHCASTHGRKVVNQLLPRTDDYFVIKPKHSGFYSTTLDLLLRRLGAKRLIVTGIAANICVLFTANDAYMRGFRLWIPGDCVASNSATENEFALQQMRKILKADIRPFAAVPRHPFLRLNRHRTKRKR